MCVATTRVIVASYRSCRRQREFSVLNAMSVIVLRISVPSIEGADGPSGLSACRRLALGESIAWVVDHVFGGLEPSTAGGGLPPVVDAINLIHQRGTWATWAGGREHLNREISMTTACKLLQRHREAEADDHENHDGRQQRGDSGLFRRSVPRTRGSGQDRLLCAIATQFVGQGKSGRISIRRRLLETLQADRVEIAIDAWPKMPGAIGWCDTCIGVSNGVSP
jgi:hypothetical protein